MVTTRSSASTALAAPSEAYRKNGNARLPKIPKIRIPVQSVYTSYLPTPDDSPGGVHALKFHSAFDTQCPPEAKYLAGTDPEVSTLGWTAPQAPAHENLRIKKSDESPKEVCSWSLSGI